MPPNSLVPKVGFKIVALFLPSAPVEVGIVAKIRFDLRQDHVFIRRSGCLHFFDLQGKTDVHR